MAARCDAMPFARESARARARAREGEREMRVGGGGGGGGARNDEKQTVKTEKVRTNEGGG